MRIYAAVGAAISCYLIANNKKKGNQNVYSRANNRNSRRSRYETRDEKLIMALVVIRHGSRTPISVVPNCEQANWDSSILLKTLPHADIPCKVVNHDGGSQPQMVYDIAYTKDKMLKVLVYYIYIYMFKIVPTYQ